MGEKTGIEWTSASWNPWYGCTKISPGCKFCYMYREMERYGRDPFTVTRSKTKFYDPLKWVKKPETTPKFCFTCSWSDFFIEQADPWRAEAWDTIRRTPQITYQILTKRPHLIRERLPEDWGEGYRNVWLGVSAETQPYWNERVPQLLDIPAALHWASLEPLLGPIDMGQGFPINGVSFTRFIRWAVVGGESGSDRVMDPDWARTIRDKCKSAGVAFFMKQMGGPASDKGGELESIPEDLRIREYPA